MKVIRENTPWNKGLKTGKPSWNSKQLDKDELYDLYINQGLSTSKIAKIYDTTHRTVLNYLHKYEIPVRDNSSSVKLERSQWTDEKELSRSKNFSKTWSQRTPEQNKERYDKMIFSGNINSPEAIFKAHQTRINNGTSNKSKSEENFYYRLILMGFNEDDIIHPYIGDSRYPFNCDFYIKSKDLFIEYQGHQTHGYEPFDKNNPKHIEILNKNSNYDMSTWTKRDPKKLETAKKNKINLVLVYPKHSTYLVSNGQIRTININDIDKI